MWWKMGGKENLRIARGKGVNEVQLLRMGGSRAAEKGPFFTGAQGKGEGRREASSERPGQKRQKVAYQ